MPEMDGLSVCDHLQDADQAPANVIVITGSRHPHTLERCERIGTYCARKGPNFWNDLKAALAEIDPRVALLP
jgi:CheY-like chemotaxis protein